MAEGSSAHLPADEALRTLVDRHAGCTTYVNMKNNAVLLGMDLPADYERLWARFEGEMEMNA